MYLRDGADVPPGYQRGWNVRYTTELTEPVAYYLRGEEYSAQIDHFVARAVEGRVDGENTSESAAATDRVIAMMLSDARKGPSTRTDAEIAEPERARRARRLRFPRLQPSRVGAGIESGESA